MISRWTFTVNEGARHAPIKIVSQQASEFVRQSFTMPFGKMQVIEQQGFFDGSTVLEWRYRFVVEAEVGPTHDPAFVTSIERRFRMFVERGWGAHARCKMDVEVLNQPPTIFLTPEPVSWNG